MCFIIKFSIYFNFIFNFWAIVCKTVRPMLSDRCPVCLSCPVCDVGVLWPNGLTVQDETWHARRPRPWPHCVRWGPSSPSPKRPQLPQFSAHICCGQMAAQIKMPLGMEVGFGPGDLVLDANTAPPPQKGGRALPIFGPCLLWPNGWMDQDRTWHGGRPQPRRPCGVRWGPSPLHKKGAEPHS